MGNVYRSNYNGLQVTLNARNFHGLSMVAGYTYSHALDDVAANWDFGYGSGLPQDSHNLAPNTGTATSIFVIASRFRSPTRSPARRATGRRWKVGRSTRLSPCKLRNTGDRWMRERMLPEWVRCPSARQRTAPSAGISLATRMISSQGRHRFRFSLATTVRRIPPTMPLATRKHWLSTEGILPGPRPRRSTCLAAMPKATRS